MEETKSLKTEGAWVIKHEESAMQCVMHAYDHMHVPNVDYLILRRWPKRGSV